MRKVCPLFCLLSLAVLVSARPRQVVTRQVSDRFQALALDKQKLTGLLGSRIRANSEGFLENVDLTSLLRPIEAGTQDLESAERQFPGQFLDAAADAFEYNHDLQLRTQMDKVATALASFAKTVLPAANTRFTEANLVNARSDLLGLLAYYRVTSDTTAYATAQTIGSFLTKQLSTDVNVQARAQLPVALAQAGLIEPLVLLYRLSGDRKYLEFCAGLAHAVAVPEIMVSTPQATLVSVFSGLGGFADLYEVTGDSNYLAPVIAAWKHVVATRLSVTGAPLPPENNSAGTIDACTAASWMQFTFKLLRVTGESAYGDQLERTVYNQILASQDSRTGNSSAEIPLNGSKLFSAALQGPSGRCLLSEAKALALLPQLVWGRYENGIAINLYAPGRAFFPLRKHGIVQIYAEGTYPQNGQLQLHVEPSKKAAQFPLRLRVPSWSSEFTVDIAGLHLNGRAGEVVIVDREWKSGDTVRVTMTLPLRTSRLVGTAVEGIVLQRGPQILTLEKALNPGIDDLGSATLRPLAMGRYQISNAESKLPRDWNGDQLYRIAGEVLGKAQDLYLVPLADALTYRVSLKDQPK